MLALKKTITRVCLLNPDPFEAARMAHRRLLAQSLQNGNRICGPNRLLKDFSSGIN